MVHLVKNQTQGSIPGLAQWVKNLVFLELWHRSQLWLGLKKRQKKKQKKKKKKKKKKKRKNGKRKKGIREANE